tara:strand:- start:827 stop:1012 length:186 start_codon:yes stop_codon:yes gene_type:complete
MPIYANRQFVLKKEFLDDVIRIHELAQVPPQSISYQSNSYTLGQKKSRSVSNNSTFLMFNK